jgi:hypothetical protein
LKLHGIIAAESEGSYLAPVEIFFSRIAKIEKYIDKLKAMLFTYCFDESYHDASEGIEALGHCCRDLKKASKFHGVLEVVINLS